MSSDLQVKVWIFIIFVAIYASAKFMGGSKVYVCRDCGYRGKALKAYKGSLLIEIILWCCFIVPGLIYSIYRASSSQKVCRNCRHPSIIPASSPILTNQDTHSSHQLKECPSCAELIRKQARKCRFCGHRL